jgi:pimeloyl-ACP methyl ester carboxylesterase
MQERKLTYHSHSIFYRIVGNGRLVVFVHGFGEDGEVWKAPSVPIAIGTPEGGEQKVTSIFDDSSLLNKFKFIVPDLPGSGRSDMIDDMSMEGMAEVIRNIIDAESSKAPSFGGGLGEACIIGHSMGGYISLAFAEKYPQYLNGLGLFHSTAYADTEEKKTARRKGIQFIKEHGAFEFLRTANYNLFSQISKDKMHGLIDEFIRSLRNFKAEALVSYYEAMIRRPDRSSILKALKIPMLFIAGNYDSAIPLNDILEQCHLPEISYFHILAESGHMGMVEEAEKSNVILNDYLINLS